MFDEPMVPLSAYFSFSFLTDITFSPNRLAMCKTHPLKQACRERLECGRSTNGTVEFSENTLDMGPTVLGLIPSVRAVSLLLAPLITSLERLSWVTTLGGGMAPRRGTTHATAFSNGLGWAFILTVVHAFAGNIFAGIACTGLVFSA